MTAWAVFKLAIAAWAGIFIAPLIVVLASMLVIFVACLVIYVVESAQAKWRRWRRSRA